MNKNYKNFNKEEVKEEGYKFNTCDFRLVENVVLTLTLDFGLSKTERTKLYPAFYNSKGESIVDYPRYEGNFTLPKEMINTTISDQSSLTINFNTKTKDFKFGLFSSRDGMSSKKDFNISGEYVIISPLSKEVKLAKHISMTGTESNLTKEEFRYYTQVGLEIAYLFSSIVETNMIKIDNSSFFSTDYGIRSMTIYLDNIYKLFKLWKEEEDLEIISKDQYKGIVEDFIKMNKSYILEERNLYNKRLAFFRLAELESVVDYDRFLVRGQSLPSYTKKDRERAKNLDFNILKDYNDYKAIPAVNRSLIKLTKFIPSKDLESLNLIIKIEDLINEKGLDFYEEIDLMERILEEDNFDITTDVIFYGKEEFNTILSKRHNLLPNFEVRTFEDERQVEYWKNKYSEEYNYYFYLLKDDILKESLKELSNYYDPMIISNLTNKNYVNNLLRQEIQKSKLMKTKITGKDLLFELMVLNRNSNIRVEEETADNEMLKDFYKQANKIYLLEKIQITLDKDIFNGTITPARQQHTIIKIAGEKDLEGFVVESNMFAPSLLIERGKALFGKTNKKDISNVKDKYVFYTFFHDINKTKDQLELLDDELNVLVEQIIKEEDKYAKLTDKEERKEQLKVLSHSFNTYNLINEKINFLNNYLTIQEIELTETEEKVFFKELKELFSNKTNIQNSYTELKSLYTKVNALITETMDKTDSYILEGDVSKAKANEKSLENLKSANLILCNMLAKKDKYLNDTLEELKLAVINEDEATTNTLMVNISNFEKELLIQKASLLRSKNALVLRNIKHIKGNEIVLYSDEEISLLDSVIELLRFDYISSNLVEDIKEDLRYKIRTTNDEVIKQALSSELNSYLLEDYLSVNKVVNDINLYSVGSYKLKELDKRLINIFKEEEQDISSYELLKELKEYYEKKNNYKDILVGLLSNYPKEVDLDRLTKEQVEDIRKWLISKYSIGKTAIERLKNKNVKLSEVKELLEKGLINSRSNKEQLTNLTEENLETKINDLIIEEEKELEDIVIVGKKLSKDNYKEGYYVLENDLLDLVKEEAVKNLEDIVLKKKELKDLPIKLDTRTTALKDDLRTYVIREGQMVDIDKKVRKTERTKYDIVKDM